MVECVVNVSEGRRSAVLDALASAAGDDLLDLHADPHHHRAVLTLAGEDAPRAVATAAVASIDLRRHWGAHPRLGAIDVVPFVALDAGDDAAGARDRFAAWIEDALGVPALTYGDGGPSLPDVRRTARRTVRAPHPTAGAVAVGVRGVLVAYNVVLAVPDLALARRVAAAVRGPGVRALGLAVGGEVQVSTNLVEPTVVGPADLHDRVAALAPVARAELVGLVPDEVLRAVPEDRWPALDLSPDRTIEARLARRS